MRRGTRITLITILYGITLLAMANMVRSLLPATEPITFTEALAEDRRHSGRKFSDSVVTLARDDRERMVAVGLESGTIDLWTTAPEVGKRSFKAHDTRADRLIFTADGKSLFSGSYFDADTKLWDVKTGELRSVIAGARGPVGRTPNPNIYVVADSTSFRLFNLETGAALPEIYDTTGVIQSLASNPRSGRVAVGTASGSLEIWQYSQDKGNPTLTQTTMAKPYATGDWVVGLHFSASGDRVLSAARKGAVDEWKSQTLENIRSITTDLGWIGAAAFLDRSKFLFWNETVIALSGTKHPSGLSDGLLQIIPPGEAPQSPIRLRTNLPAMTDTPSHDGFRVIHSRAAEIFPATP